jgi:GNAT superfamily N-acetyltransferase
MRHDIFNVEYGWKEYDGSECKFDREGKVVIATHNGEVVGGMRIMFSDCCEYLSNEVPGTQYEYRKLIQKYDNREDLVFGEISSLFVKKDYRHSEVATSMMEKLFNKAKDHGCNYIFAVAVATVCRNDRRTAKRFGYDVEIVMQYPWLQKKVFNYVRLFPMYSKLK